MKHLIENIKSLAKRSDGEKILQTLTIITNLMHESSEHRRTAAKYRNTFVHDKLKIDVCFDEK